MKRYALILLWAIALLLSGDSARAFYSPTTGRWLSRDPIGEKDGPNVYAFTRNSSCNRIDPHGLDSCGTCGPSVTRELQRTLQSVQTTFNNWSRDEKLTACNRLHGYIGTERKPIPWQQRLGNAIAAWDILELAYLSTKFPNYVPPYQPLGAPGICHYTVGFQGKCYYAAQVNYALFGKAHRLCDNEFKRETENAGEWSLPSAIRYVILYKALLHRNDNPNDPEIRKQINQAFAFTAYGFDSSLIPSASTACKDCRVQPSVAATVPFNWTWLPYVPRAFGPD